MMHVKLSDEQWGRIRHRFPEKLRHGVEAVTLEDVARRRLALGG